MTDTCYSLINYFLTFSTFHPQCLTFTKSFIWLFYQSHFKFYSFIPLTVSQIISSLFARLYLHAFYFLLFPFSNYKFSNLFKEELAKCFLMIFIQLMVSFKRNIHFKLNSFIHFFNHICLFNFEVKMGFHFVEKNLMSALILGLFLSLKK